MNKLVVETDKGQKVSHVQIVNGNVEIVYQKDLPESVKDIPNRDWFVNSVGNIMQTTFIKDRLNNVSTKERAEAILALGQLLELAAYVGVDGFNFNFVFEVSKQELAKEFKEKYSDLFQKAKKLL
jgi:hypothetical protein